MAPVGRRIERSWLTAAVAKHFVGHCKHVRQDTDRAVETKSQYLATFRLDVGIARLSERLA